MLLCGQISNLHGKYSPTAPTTCRTLWKVCVNYHTSIFAISGWLTFLDITGTASRHVSARRPKNAVRSYLRFWMFESSLTVPGKEVSCISVLLWRCHWLSAEKLWRDPTSPSFRCSDQRYTDCNISEGLHLILSTMTEQPPAPWLRAWAQPMTE